MRRSILTEKVARRGHHLAREYRVDPFVLTRVREIMVTDVQTVPDSMTLHQLAAFLTDPATYHPSFPVVDGDGRVLGIVDPPAVLAGGAPESTGATTLNALLAGTNPCLVAYPDEYLEAVIDRMSRQRRAYAGGVARRLTLEGYLSWRDLLRVRTRLQQEEKQRIRFYRRTPSTRRSAMASDARLPMQPTSDAQPDGFRRTRHASTSDPEPV